MKTKEKKQSRNLTPSLLVNILDKCRASHQFAELNWRWHYGRSILQARTMFPCASFVNEQSHASLAFDWMLMLSCCSTIILEFSRLCLTRSLHLRLSWTWPQLLRRFFSTNVYIHRIFHWNLLLFLNLKVWKITTVNHKAIRFNKPQMDPHLYLFRYTSKALNFF